MSIILSALYNEINRRFILLWKYRFNVLMQILTVALLYIGASFFIGNGRFDSSQLAATLLGYIVWFYARIMIMSTGSELIGEAQAGTLEQMYMSPVPSWVLLIGRMTATLLTTTIMVILPSLGLALIFGIQYPLHWEGIPVLLLTLTGLFGFSLAISGAALVFKQIDVLADLTQNLMLFLTGALLPITLFPDWLTIFARTLPITQGIIVLREVMLKGASFGEEWLNGNLIWLIVHSTIYVLVGWFIFMVCESKARSDGLLGQY